MARLDWKTAKDGRAAVVQTRSGHKAVITPTEDGNQFLWRCASPGIGKTEGGVADSVDEAKVAVGQLPAYREGSDYLGPLPPSVSRQRSRTGWHPRRTNRITT
jgi:hypothetical protein